MTGNGKINPHNGAHNGKWHDAAGKFLPGNPGKRLGSSKHKLREKIKTFIDTKWDELPEWFDKLKPKEKMESLISLLPFALARLQSISMTDSEGNDLKSEAKIDYTKLSESSLKEILQHTTIEDNEEA